MTTSNAEGSVEKKMTLYSSFVSPPAYSVRIALNLKGLDYELKPINVLTGEQSNPEFVKISPMGYVPTLVDGDLVLVESLAIILYLEEKYPQHPFLPLDIKKRALNYQVANIVSSSIQCTIRMPILVYVRDNVGTDEWIPWVHDSIGKGFAALEILLKDHVGKYATGDEIYLADLLLAPHIVGVKEELKFDISVYPLLSKLGEAYKDVPAIQKAMPQNQPDFHSLEGVV